MESKELVSIVVPIFNTDKYLEQSINSLLNQTYQNIEIILVNDGSTDTSSEICKIYAEKYKNIIYKSQINSGVSVARNKGISISKGKWICFVDPDDYVERDMIEKLMEYSSIKNIDLICAAPYVFQENSSKESYSFYESKQLFYNDTKAEFYKQLMDSSYGQNRQPLTAIGVPWGKLYRSEIIKKNNLEFYPNLRRMQDNIFNAYFLYYCNKAIYVNIHVYNYRLDNISNYAKKNNEKVIEYFYQVILERKKFLEYSGLIEDKILYQFFLKESLNFLLESIRAVEESENLSFSKKREKIKNLISKDEYRESLKVEIKTTKSMKIRKNLIKSNQLTVLIYLDSLIKTVKKYSN